MLFIKKKSPDEQLVQVQSTPALHTEHSDWVRAVYFIFMFHTGLADTYRNEHFVSKPDFIYNYERNMLAINFANPDKAKVARNIMVSLNHTLLSLGDAFIDEN